MQNSVANEKGRMVHNSSLLKLFSSSASLSSPSTVCSSPICPLSPVSSSLQNISLPVSCIENSSELWKDTTSTILSTSVCSSSDSCSAFLFRTDCGFEALPSPKSSSLSATTCSSSTSFDVLKVEKAHSYPFSTSSPASFSSFSSSLFASFVSPPPSPFHYCSSPPIFASFNAAGGTIKGNGGHIGMHVMKENDSAEIKSTFVEDGDMYSSVERAITETDLLRNEEKILRAGRGGTRWPWRYWRSVKMLKKINANDVPTLVLP